MTRPHLREVSKNTVDNTLEYLTLHWLFKDSGHYLSALPEHFFWLSNIDRYYLHNGCRLHAFSPEISVFTFLKHFMLYNIINSSRQNVLPRVGSDTSPRLETHQEHIRRRIKKIGFSLILYIVTDE